MPSEFLFEKGQFSVGFLTAMAHLDMVSSQKKSPGVPLTLKREREKHPETFMALKQSFLKAFKVMDKELRMHY
ncbi:putative protein phosphatase 2C 33 [Iris pallida]|uniref:Uncharacterized protein n=1 Tax=Iris pallida TaxID=29817 RepID=A0AAX6DUH8_IRIPA|nr:putative protein phosphatase 2C 33 [Iris pallida]